MRIVLSYAASAPGHAALAAALDEAVRHDAEVIVVNSARADDGVTEVELPADELLQMDRSFAAAGITWRIMDSDPALFPGEAVVAIANEVAADLIVLGVTDRQHVEKRFVSRTTRDVLLDASCAVITVRGDKPPRLTATKGRVEVTL